MAIVEELLELEDTPMEIVHSGATPISFAFKATSVAKQKWWESQWLKTIATIWIPILTCCYLIISVVVGHAVKDLNAGVAATVSTQLKPFVAELTDVNSRLHTMEGWKEGVEGDVRILKENQNTQDQKQKQLEALSRLLDPRRILATIRAEIDAAKVRKEKLPVSQVADYRNALNALPSSVADYWTTVSAVINYQSLLNQMSGEAPDPTTVAMPCGLVGPNSGHNSITGQNFRDCFVFLDTNLFRNVTFQDSVIHYRGGAVGLVNVKFINCTFVLELPAKPATPAQEKMLRALLDSPDQKNIQVSN